jgi:hypothetical protein
LCYDLEREGLSRFFKPFSLAHQQTLTKNGEPQSLSGIFVFWRL